MKNNPLIDTMMELFDAKVELRKQEERKKLREVFKICFVVILGCVISLILI